jgi:hypothetical protein
MTGWHRNWPPEFYGACLLRQISGGFSVLLYQSNCISQPPWLGRYSPPAAGHAMAVLDAQWPTPWQPCIGDGGSAFSAPRQQAKSSTPLAAALKSARIHTFGLRCPLHLSNECGAENTP